MPFGAIVVVSPTVVVIKTEFSFTDSRPVPSQFTKRKVHQMWENMCLPEAQRKTKRHVKQKQFPNSN
jgi:hypothetical protein